MITVQGLFVAQALALLVLLVICVRLAARAAEVRGDGPPAGAPDPADRPVSAVVLATRLSETVPQDAWSADAAHAWWDQHRINERKGSGGGAALDKPESAGERRRCWPRLDSDAAIPRIARVFLPRRG